MKEVMRVFSLDAICHTNDLAVGETAVSAGRTWRGPRPVAGSILLKESSSNQAGPAQRERKTNRGRLGTVNEALSSRATEKQNVAVGVFDLEASQAVMRIFQRL